jgi:hypothetical protein
LIEEWLKLPAQSVFIFTAQSMPLLQEATAQHSASLPLMHLLQVIRQPLLLLPNS